MQYRSRLYKALDLRSVEFGKWKDMLPQIESDELSLWCDVQILECLFQDGFIDTEIGLCIGSKALQEVLESHELLMPCGASVDSLLRKSSNGINSSALRAYVRTQFSHLTSNTAQVKFAFVATSWLLSQLSSDQSFSFINLLFRDYLKKGGHVVFSAQVVSREEFDVYEQDKSLTSDDVVELIDLLNSAGYLVEFDQAIESIDFENSSCILLNISTP